MTHAEMVKAFNEWMRRFIEEPDRYQREFQMVNDFIRDEAAGDEPTYGEACTAYLEQLTAEFTAG